MTALDQLRDRRARLTAERGRLERLAAGDDMDAAMRAWELLPRLAFEIAWLNRANAAEIAERARRLVRAGEGGRGMEKTLVKLEANEAECANQVQAMIDARAGRG